MRSVGMIWLQVEALLQGRYALVKPGRVECDVATVKELFEVFLTRTLARERHPQQRDGRRQQVHRASPEPLALASGKFSPPSTLGKVGCWRPAERSSTA